MEELLALRESERDAEANAHLGSCERCRSELERLRRLRHELRALPQLEPRRDVWPLVAAGTGRRKRLRWIAAGTVWLAAAAISGLFLLRGPTVDGADPLDEAPVAQAPTELVPLIDRSRQLESVLSYYVPERPVLDASSALAVSVLEERLTLIDQALAESQSAGLNGALVHDLWQQRVDALETLVGVHVVQQEANWGADSGWR